MESRITVTKETDFNEWYHQILLKGNFIKNSGVSGCYVILPNSYAIWENIQGFMDKHLKEKGVKNCYFPLFIRKENLEKEKDHLEGFNPEVAWVTKTGDHELAENNALAIRPTSECGMYPIFKDMVRNHNDLPLRLNQWCNVVRWEFKDATPFIRSREFLWQEGHTCHKDEASSIDEVLDILELYNMVYASVLAVPMIKGVKTEKEKFSGASRTFTVETFIKESGRAVQAATAHCLGQNFSKIFDIKFQDSDEAVKHVYQNSWGFTTRSIGIALMVHGDDAGAVVPPFVADVQIVVVPIHRKQKDLDEITEYYNKEVKPRLSKFRLHFDDSKKRPGAKYNYWERMGVPLRIEIGKREVRDRKITVCRRDNKAKGPLELEDSAAEGYDRESTFTDHLHKKIYDVMYGMTVNMYEKAEEKLVKSIKTPKNQTEFKDEIENKNMCLISWCNSTECEERIKEETGAKSLCLPLDKRFRIHEQKSEDGEQKVKTCMFSGKPCKVSCLFGKSY